MTPDFALSPARPGTEIASRAVKPVLIPLQALIAWPSLLFLLALTAMLLRHPDVSFYEIDRIAFALLILGVVGRRILEKRTVIFFSRASLPMIGLTLLAVIGLWSQSADPEAWSLLAAKFVVPFTLFHLAQVVFTGERKCRQFETFSLIVLAYLSFTSIAFLVGAKSLIFPRFILDESLGFHADRARGPLLQAVANGVSLNLLGLLALHSFRRRAVGGFKAILLLASVPIAILATMTRAVWLSFAVTIIALIFVSGSRKVLRASVGLVLVAVMGLLVAMSCDDFSRTLGDRFAERGPVDYREAVYAGGWRMFLERPFFGWGFHRMPSELPRFVSGYEEKVLYPHNTYLELLVELGMVGLALYVWMMIELWRLGRSQIPAGEEGGFLDRQFHCLWPILLIVYWLNAAVVAMSYQFVNGLLFTMAGMLAAQRRRAEGRPC